MHPVETYLEHINAIRSTGGAVPETSYYGALENLLDEVGKTLKPKVRCVPQLAGTGAGSPDFGLYAENQFVKSKRHEPLAGQPPERGVVEVKSFSDDSWVTAEGKQVSKYWGHYGQVLVTNYRDFVFIGRDENGNPIKLETFRLAENEMLFRAAASQPRKTALQHGDRLVEYLRRVMLHAAPLSEPEHLAWYLASYAREAKARIEEMEELPGLAALRGALEDSLGLKFEGEEGERFFKATLVQTLFYGVFSSWVLWAKERGNKTGRFNWHEAAWNLHVPMIAGLFEQIATPKQLKPLGLDEVLDWTGMVLNRVTRSAFFEKFEEKRAVQYFYEPFLKAYDPELRKELGVWYTPPEIVKYQVTRVDTVLREELDIEDGLADPNVYVLDPCCGTGAYLVEVINKIHETLKASGDDALIAQRLKRAVMDRVFGFEILPAPFVVSHLQIGLLLKNLNAPLSDEKNERAGVYLTNALTGWEPPKKPKDQIPLPFPELQEEKDAAEKVKRDTPILVILGNPPYNAFAGTSPEEEGGLVEPYKEGLRSEWGILAGSMHDLYIRFFRIAERRIAKGGKGIVCYISNFSYLGDPSFVVMRQKFLKEFDKLWFDCMNGDSRETGKLTPEGNPDPSVFSTEQNKEGIRVGTTICLMVRKEKRAKNPSVNFRHLWGVTKRKDVLESLKAKNFDKQYKAATPEKSNRFSFKLIGLSGEYLSWPSLMDLCSQMPTNGLMEKRGGALIDIDRDELRKRMMIYFENNVDWETYCGLGLGLEKERAEIDPKKLRERAMSEDKYDDNNIIQYSIRPFDNVWAYYSEMPKLWSRSRPNYWKQCWEGNNFFMSRFRTSSSPEGVPCYFVKGLSDDHFIMPDNSCFPIRIRKERETKKNHDLPGLEEKLGDNIIKANLSSASHEYLKSIRIINPDKDAYTAGLIWFHALSIGYSPAYLTGNADGIRQDWPRIPLPDSKDVLLSSAELGGKVAALLDTESGVSGVTKGKIRRELSVIGRIMRKGGGGLNPDSGDIELTAGWGHGGKNDVCMPGKGHVETRRYSSDELKALEAGAVELGLTLDKALDLLGDTTCDIYLNGQAFWSNIPRNVWEYYIGGYQVIKKWLSYREKSILGRSLKMEEADYVTEISRRLSAIILLQPNLDGNYLKVKSSTYAWK